MTSYADFVARGQDAAIVAIVLLGVALAVVRSIGLATLLLAAQSLFLGLGAIAIGIQRGSAELVAGGLLTIGLRAVVLPLIVRRLLRDSPVRTEANAYLGRRASAVVATLIVFASYAIATGVAGSSALSAAAAAASAAGASAAGAVGAAGAASSAGGAAAAVGSVGSGAPSAATMALAAAIAEVLTGLLIIATRRKSLSMVIGLLVFENGIALAAISLVAGMPLVVELGAAFDILLVMVVVQTHARRMLTTFGSLSTDRLRSLRG